jgi:hypothetical protein
MKFNLTLDEISSIASMAFSAGLKLDKSILMEDESVLRSQIETVVKKVIDNHLVSEVKK